jgi:DNA-binding IclR family transcriptional regulator
MTRLRRPDERGDRRRGIQSVDASAAILETFIRADGPRSLSVIAKEAGISSSTAHRYLVSLTRGGFVLQETVSGHYDLGPSALRMGLAAMRRLDAVGYAIEAGRNLNLLTGIACTVNIWSERGPMVVRWLSGQTPLVTTVGIGAVLPIVGSASGRLFAAHLERAATDKLVRRELKHGHYGITAMEKFERILRDARRRGYAAIDGLVASGIRGLSAPVFDLQGRIQATVNLLSLNHALVELPNATLAQLLHHTRNASRRLGFDDDQTLA